VAEDGLYFRVARSFPCRSLGNDGAGGDEQARAGLRQGSPTLCTFGELEFGGGHASSVHRSSRRGDVRECCLLQEAHDEGSLLALQVRVEIGRRDADGQPHPAVG
jgi:hypothetical protein